MRCRMGMWYTFYLMCDCADPQKAHLPLRVHEELVAFGHLRFLEFMETRYELQTPVYFGNEYGSIGWL
jgi:hypothetical protein